MTSLVVPALTWIWLIGGTLLTGYILVKAFRLWQAVTAERPLTDQGILDTLEDCKMQMRLRTLVGVVITDKVHTPALFGFIRPRILLPQGLIETLGLDELHCVFLHELAHLKRRDIYLAWLVCLLQVLHWFNPLIWFAFRRMRADQEMAADALALAAAGAEESRRYGQTIVNLLERFSRPQYLPSLAGILENPSHIERRMTMIARFKNNSYRWSLLALALIVMLACVGLPDAKRTKAADGTAARRTPGAGAGPIVKTLYSGKDMGAGYGVLAPDESTIATGGGGISLLDLRTGETRTLTESMKGDGWGPIWSPDSKLIVYFLVEQDQESLRIVSREGGEPRTIRSVKDEHFDPSDWSQDGKLLVGERMQWGQAGEPPALATVNVVTGELHVLGAEGLHARISPDGRFVVYERTVDGNRDVFVVNIDGAQTTRLTDSPAEDGSPIFFR